MKCNNTMACFAIGTEKVQQLRVYTVKWYYLKNKKSTLELKSEKNARKSQQIRQLLWKDKVKHFRSKKLYIITREPRK